MKMGTIVDLDVFAHMLEPVEPRDLLRGECINLDSLLRGRWEFNYEYILPGIACRYLLFLFFLGLEQGVNF